MDEIRKKFLQRIKLLTYNKKLLAKESGVAYPTLLKFLAGQPMSWQKVKVIGSKLLFSEQELLVFIGVPMPKTPNVFERYNEETNTVKCVCCEQDVMSAEMYNEYFCNDCSTKVVECPECATKSSVYIFAMSTGENGYICMSCGSVFTENQYKHERF